MKVKATTSFTGALSMHKNEERECVENDTLNSLIKCGYVVPVKLEKKAVPKNENKRSKSQ